ncbi:MAG TPA: DUF1540 domain-containing protein [Clostridiales bacterium]|nr:DUF1540 domain-containing protein [Clostridiales bacterium]
MEERKCSSTTVKCEVENCSYHSKDNICMADSIEVGPGFAKSSDETVCVTFRPKFY